MAKNPITFKDNVQAVITALQENLDLLDLRIFEEEEKVRNLKEGRSPADIERRIEDIKMARERVDKQLAALKEVADKGSEYAVPTFDDLKGILNLIKAFREDVYMDSYAINNSEADASKLRKIDVLVAKVVACVSEEIAKPKKATYEHIITGMSDLTYSRYMQYHLKKKLYMEKRDTIKSEMERIEGGIDDQSEEFTQLNSEYQQLLVKAKELQKAKANGSISPIMYSTSARTLKTKIDIINHNMMIKASAFNMRLKTVMANITTCSQVFAVIDSSLDNASREDFMDFADRSMDALDAVYRVLMSNFPSDADVKTMTDAVHDLQTAAQEAFERSQIQEQIIEPIVVPIQPLDLDEDPLAGLFDEKLSDELDNLIENNPVDRRFKPIDSDDDE